VLSLFPHQHPEDLIEAHRPSLDQADDQAHMLHDRERRLALGDRNARGLRSLRQQIPSTVLSTLLLGVFAVVRHATAGVALAAVRRPASKAAAQIETSGVTRMGQE